MYILCFLILIIIVPIFYQIWWKNEAYCDYQTNYANGIYAIRPPYKKAQKFNPNKLAPIRILKNNFLNYPIEGYQSDIEHFSFRDFFKNNTESLENGIDKMRGSNSVNNNEQNIRDMVKAISTEKGKDVPMINEKIQKISLDIVQKPQYQKDLQKFKFFDNDKCSNSDNNSNEGYMYTGAFFTTTQDSGISCNNVLDRKVKRCKVKVKLQDGKVDKISIEDCGRGYIKPTIKILANDNTGTGALAKITAMGDDGSIKYIEVIDGGRGYKEIPTVEIKSEKINNTCYLCVR